MLYYINPLTWLGWVAQFIQSWVLGFKWGAIPAAIPAILVLVTMLVGTSLVYSSSRAWRERLVEGHMINAYSEENYEVVEMLLKRQIRTNPDDEQLQMRLASAYESMEKQDEAREIFRTLAFDKASGRAAMWLLEKDYDREKAAEWPEEKTAEFGELTRVALVEFPENKQLNAFRAGYLMQRGELQEAITHLDKLTSASPVVGMQIAGMLRARGEEEKARAYSESSNKMIEKMVADEPKRTELRLLHAQSLISLKRHRDALNTLVEGFQQTKDERFRGAIGEAMILYSEAIAKESQDPNTLKLRLQLLKKASDVAPAHPAVIKAIADTILSTVNEEDDQVAALRQSLIDGTTPAMRHFIQGTVAMMQEKPELAAIELQLAAQEMPNSVAILNNLAFAKMSVAKEQNNDPKVLQQALDLSDKAIELVQKVPEAGEQMLFFRETRGQIYLLQGKYIDAIADLGAAVQVPALSIQSNQAISEAYEKLGQPEMAAMHREAAESLIAQAAAEKEKNVDALEQFGDSLRQQSSELSLPVKSEEK
jgi:tetratricopeptide (TPR) repeat protein